MTEQATVILRDNEGAFYLITPELLAQARASDEEQAELAHVVEEQDTAGYVAGPGLPFIVVGLTAPVVSPRDAASGLPTGKRMHQPFVITKTLDKSSPIIFS